MRTGAETSVCSPPRSASECLPFTGSRRRLCGFRETPGGRSGSLQARGHGRPQPGLRQPRGQPGGRGSPPGPSSSQRGPGSRDAAERSGARGWGPAGAGPGSLSRPGDPSSLGQKNAAVREPTEPTGEGLKEPAEQAGRGLGASPEQPQLFHLGVTGPRRSAHLRARAPPKPALGYACRGLTRKSISGP